MDGIPTAYLPVPSAAPLRSFYRKSMPGDRKFYCIDNGLRRTLIHTGSEDKGSLLENNRYLFL